MIKLAQTIDTAIEPLRKIADLVGAPLFDLAARFYLAYVFFKSGMLRFNDFLNGTWSNQIFLFELEHPVPGVPPGIAAIMATTGELVLPALLVLGLFGRFAAAGIIIMTLVIELTYIHATDHIIWFILAASIFIKGPGVLSADFMIRRYLQQKKL
jgi:putative oxidoreductase